jgi:hypothetical protein
MKKRNTIFFIVLSFLLLLFILGLAIMPNHSPAPNPKKGYQEKMHLKYCYTIQKAHYQSHFRYANAQEMKELVVFPSKELFNCDFFVLRADTSKLLIQAVNWTDYDQDGIPRIYTIDEKGDIKLLQDD